MQLVLKGVQRYWFHAGLVSLIQKIEGWDEKRIKDFLSKNNMVFLNNLSISVILAFLEDLEKNGFTIQLEKTQKSITASIGISVEQELEGLKREVSGLLTRLNELEIHRKASEPAPSIKGATVYQELASQKVERKAFSKVPETVKQVQEKIVRSRETKESNIGKYWLSRIGIFTLVLGLVLFISYSFQFIGPLGKVLIGVANGVLLTGLGNFWALKEKYRRWSMAAIGGGWAILYFTVYAAYQIPAAKVITNPFLAFLFLVLVMIGSIAQSLKFRSAVLVFFSYFLAYVSITMLGVTFYTLIASFLLAVSIVGVTYRMGWTWLALLGLAAVYLTHAVWVQQVLVGGGAIANGSFYDALILPWAGEEWRIYPLISLDQSLLHQAFLILYWILFATIGFLKSEKAENQTISFWLLFSNNLIFTTSYIHHLHVYHPDIKIIFPVVMGLVFLFLAWVEKKEKRGLLSDLYLAFGTTLFALTIPMFFKGPWITHGWSAGFVLLSWLGLRHRHVLLYRMAWVLGGAILCRLMFFDYLEQRVLFTFLFSVQTSFLIFSISALAFAANYFFHQRSLDPAEKERHDVESCFLIIAFAVFACGVLVGGFRSASSVIWLFEGALLLWLGIRQSRMSFRVASTVISSMVALRFAFVDCRFGIMKMFSDFHVGLRLAAVGLSLAVILWMGNWLRYKGNPGELKDVPVISRWWSIVGSLLLMVYVYDPDLSSWISIIWGGFAFLFIIAGFALKDRIDRWIGLGIFAVVLLRLFFHDFAYLQTIYRIVSFIGLGVVLIGASFLYSYYAKHLLDSDQKNS